MSNSPASSLNSSPRARSSLRRYVWIFLLLLIAAGGGYLWLSSAAAERELQEAIAEADRTDPGWRLEEMLNYQRPLRPKNAAGIHLLKAFELLGQDTLIPIDTQDNRPNPNVLFAPENFQAMREFAELHGVALREARKITAQPIGLPWATYIHGDITGDPNLETVNAVYRVLLLDALVNIQGAHLADALKSCLNIYYTAQTWSEDTAFIFQSRRHRMLSVFCQLLERILAQGEVDGLQLARIQKVVNLFDDNQVFQLTIKAERARRFAFFQAVRDEAISKEELKSRSFTLGWMDQITPGYWTRQQGVLLAYMNKLVEFAKSSPDVKYSAYTEIARQLPVKRLHHVAGVLEEKFVADLASFFVNRAALQCAESALAAERFRIAHGRWPTDWNAMVKAGFLRQVPIDPFDEKPFRLQVLEDGWCVYSAPRTSLKMDNPETALEFHLGYSKSDLGFRLWNPAARRQPAPVLEIEP